MRRKIAFLLACLMIFSMVGCTKNSSNTTSESTTIFNGNVETTTGENDTLSLKDFYAKYNMKAGTCITSKMLVNMSQSKLIKEQFNSVTMENSMKPEAILNRAKSTESGDLVVEFNVDMTKCLDWAKANNMAVRGHTLIWYSQTPDWIFYENFDTQASLASREVMLARMESFIKQVFEKLTEKGYIDLFYAYDVVNEAWMENGTMRDNYWLQTIGDDYLWYAFYYANKYAPESIDLYYNDYNEQFKGDTLAKFVKTLVDADGNYLIDGVGFQAHLYTADNVLTYLKAIDKVAATGVKIQITELDVGLGSYQKAGEATEENFKKQGTYYYNLIKGIMDRIDAGTLKMDSLTFWGISDTLSWRKEHNPLLFNGKYEPKYAFYGAMQIRDKAGFAEQ